MLKVEGLTKTFGGLTALDNVSFEVNERDIVGIIGPNGSGKTTLFEIISGFCRPSSSKVFFDGARIDGLKPHQVFKRGLVRTFQLMENYQSLTAYEAMLLPSLCSSVRGDGHIRPEQVLAELGFGANTASPLAHLSLPDRHVVELTRAIISRPRMVLLDEVMSGLGPEQISLVVNVIRNERARGTSFLIIEHHLETIMDLCDRLIVLDLGHKIVEGIPAEVVADERVISSYLGVGARDALGQ